MDELYLAIEHEMNGLIDAVWAYRTEENPDMAYWEPVAELPIPYLEGAVSRCPRWRAALERLLETALVRWPRPGMPFETVNPRLEALRAVALALVNEKVGAEGEAWERWVAATNRIGSILHEVRAMAVAAGERTAADSSHARAEPAKNKRQSADQPSYEQQMQQVAQAVGDGNTVRILAVAHRSDLSGEERMEAIIELDRRFVGKSSADWGKLLNVTANAVRGYPLWKELQKRRRADG